MVWCSNFKSSIGVNLKFSLLLAQSCNQVAKICLLTMVHKFKKLNFSDYLALIAGILLVILAICTPYIFIKSQIDSNNTTLRGKVIYGVVLKKSGFNKQNITFKYSYKGKTYIKKRGLNMRKGLHVNGKIKLLCDTLAPQHVRVIPNTH